METKRHNATGEGDTMTVNDGLMFELLTIIGGAGKDATSDQRVLRSELLSEWEKRYGGDFVDAAMESLEPVGHYGSAGAILDILEACVAQASALLDNETTDSNQESGQHTSECGK